MNPFHTSLLRGLIGMLVMLNCRDVDAQLRNDRHSRGINLESRNEHPSKIEKTLLGATPKSLAGPPVGESARCKCVGMPDSPSVRKISDALESPLHSKGFDFTDVPLQHVVAFLREEYGIAVQLDRQALDEVGVGPEEPVTINLNGITLRSALRHLLRSVELTYCIRDEVLLITSFQRCEEILQVCVYDVGSITGTSEAQMEAVIDTIESCVATDTWASNGGGKVTMRPLKPGLLVISQTTSVHEEIRDLLAAIRSSLADADQEQVSTTAHERATDLEVVTRYYLLQNNPANDIKSMQAQVRELITASLPKETWSGHLANGEQAALIVFHDRVVVRQTATVQEKVQQILIESGLAMPSAAASPGARRGSVASGMGGSGYFNTGITEP